MKMNGRNDEIEIWRRADAIEIGTATVIEGANMRTAMRIVRVIVMRDEGTDLRGEIGAYRQTVGIRGAGDTMRKMKAGKMIGITGSEIIIATEKGIGTGTGKETETETGAIDIGMTVGTAQGIRPRDMAVIEIAIGIETVTVTGTLTEGEGMMIGKRKQGKEDKRPPVQKGYIHN